MSKIPHLTWKDSIWFSDIDDTLIGTADLTIVASAGIYEVLKVRFGEDKAAKIQQNFIEIFNLMVLGLRNHSDEDWIAFPGKKEAYQKVWSQVEYSQQEIKQQFGAIKKFSREIFIKIAVEQEGLLIDPETIYEAADGYWLTLSEKTELLPGVAKLMQEITKHNRPLFLVTSSDARLKLKDNGQFVYDPSYSEAFKRERVQLLRQKGIDFNVVSIGDPEDKPHMDFFEKGVKAAESHLGYKIDLSKAIIMGDSFAADLQTPKEKLGFGLAILYKQGKETTEVIDEHYMSTGNLADVTKFLE